MSGRYEVHEWLRSMSEQEKKELFKKFTEKHGKLWDEYLEASYDASH